MSVNPPKGWTRENDKLLIHTSGVRVQLMTYRGKDGWYLVPDDLDQPLVPFDPTPEGRDKAFEAFANGVLKTKGKAKPAAEKRKKAAKAPDPEEEGAVKPAKEGDEEEDEEEKGKEEDEGDEP